MDGWMDRFPFPRGGAITDRGWDRVINEFPGCHCHCGVCRTSGQYLPARLRETQQIWLSHMTTALSSVSEFYSAYYPFGPPSSAWLRGGQSAWSEIRSWRGWRGPSNDRVSVHRALRCGAMRVPGRWPLTGGIGFSSFFSAWSGSDWGARFRPGQGGMRARMAGQYVDSDPPSCCGSASSRLLSGARGLGSAASDFSVVALCLGGWVGLR